MSNWKDSLSALCYLIRKPTHALTRKCLHYVSVCVFMFLCVSVCMSTVCVGGDMCWKWLMLLRCCLVLHVYTWWSPWCNSQHLSSYELLACNHHHTEVVALTITAVSSSFVFYGACDRLNNDGRLATRAGNRVKKIYWLVSKAWDVNSLHCMSLNILITANFQAEQQQNYCWLDCIKT